MQMQAIGIELYGRSLNAFQLQITSLHDQNDFIIYMIWDRIKVREALKDEHLQKLISDINSSLDALNVSDELDKYMGLDFFAFSVIRYLIIFNPVLSYISTLTIFIFSSSPVGFLYNYTIVANQNLVMPEV
ncbi:hypothetical protein Goklo_027502 [Gossypium klotzschianum]|nr:hypothetical protein [Gossypium klotzschianum]